jgi:hypothetical protein
MVLMLAALLSLINTIQSSKQTLFIFFTSMEGLLTGDAGQSKSGQSEL